MSKILALCGSLRARSMNAALLRAAARISRPEIQVRIFGGLANLPLFNPDLETHLPAPVRVFHEALGAADSVLVASPEYAHGVTGTLKNALDWLVGFEGFVGKRIAIFNASPRSVHADASLREILVTMSARIVDDACLALPLRSTGLTEQGIVDSGHAPRIRAALDALGKDS
jgi:chromate reductase, NAD(P)H dehydrogenase (quinone)